MTKGRTYLSRSVVVGLGAVGDRPPEEGIDGQGEAGGKTKERPVDWGPPRADDSFENLSGHDRVLPPPDGPEADVKEHIVPLDEGAGAGGLGRGSVEGGDDPREVEGVVEEEREPIEHGEDVDDDKVEPAPTTRVTSVMTSVSSRYDSSPRQPEGGPVIT